MAEHPKPDVDPHLVRIENALDDHAFSRKNSTDPEELERVNEELADEIANSPETPSHPHFHDEHKWEP
jgi:hypothetical protein